MVASNKLIFGDAPISIAISSPELETHKLLESEPVLFADAEVSQHLCKLRNVDRRLSSPLPITAFDSCRLRDGNLLVELCTGFSLDSGCVCTIHCFHVHVQHLRQPAPVKVLQNVSH